MEVKPTHRMSILDRWANHGVRWLLVAIISLEVLTGFSAEVIQVRWTTTRAAPPVQFQGSASNFLPTFRTAIQLLPESSIVALALGQPTLLGLTQQQATELQPLVAHRYALLEQSAPYSNVKSALPYCFSAERPTNGLASAYVPTGATSNTPTILFIHGYGGSFLWYQHYLSENFPGHIIISPAYGISAATIPQAYVAESVDAISKRLGFKLSNLNLIGLSAGGFGACRLYALEPRFYRQMICLAAYPPDDTISRFLRDSRLRFLAGAMEPYVASGEFNRRIDRVRRVCSTVEARTIPKSDHFFLLTEQGATLDCLRKWLSDRAEDRAP